MPLELVARKTMLGARRPELRRERIAHVLIVRRVDLCEYRPGLHTVTDVDQAPDDLSGDAKA